MNYARLSKLENPVIHNPSYVTCLVGKFKKNNDIEGNPSKIFVFNVGSESAFCEKNALKVSDQLWKTGVPVDPLIGPIK